MQNRYIVTIAAVAQDGTKTVVFESGAEYRLSSSGKPMLHAQGRVQLGGWPFQVGVNATAVQPTIKAADGSRVADPNQPTPSFEALRSKL